MRRHYEYMCPACDEDYESPDMREGRCPACGEAGRRVYSVTPLYYPSRTQKPKKRSKDAAE